MPKKYTQEEIKKIKDDLFEKAVYVRGLLKDAPLSPFNISDDQIRSNIDKKFNIYLRAKEYNDTTDSSIKNIGEKFKKDNPNFVNLLRGSFFSGHTEDEYDNLLKQTNTPAKSEHYRQQIIKNILSINPKEVVDATLDFEKTLDYAEKNRKNIECGFQASAIVEHGTGGTFFSESIKNLVVKNKTLYETTFATMRDNINLLGSPLYYLFEETKPHISDEQLAGFLVHCKDTIYRQDNKNPLDIQLRNGIGDLAHNPNIEKIEKLQKALEGKDITNLLYMKSTDKTKSLTDSLLENIELKPLDPVEKRKLDADFNKFEIAAIYDKINSKPEESLPLTEEEKTEKISENLIIKFQIKIL